MPDTPPKIVIDDTRPAKPSGTAKPVASATAINADVKKALATLDSGYNLIATGLTIMGLTETATTWLDTVEDLKLTNEDALKASPKLAKAIASTGSVGGGATFFVTHGMAVIALVTALRSELADKRADAYIAEHPVPDTPPA